MAITGRRLNKQWGVGARHALYRSDGRWYHVLSHFPGALFDADGYVLFETRDEYESCTRLRIKQATKTVHVDEPGISAIPGYVVVKPR